MNHPADETRVPERTTETESAPGPASSTATIIIHIAVLLVNLGPRLYAFGQLRADRLEPDANAFYALAMKPVGLWTAAPREPFFIWLHRLALIFSGGERWGIRVQSLVFALALAGLITAVSLRCFRGRVAAAIPGVILGLTPFMVFQATRGLRLELYVSLALGLGLLLFPAKAELSWRRAVGAGLLAAAMCLTRQVGIMVAAGLFAAALLKSGSMAGARRVWPRLALAAGLALLLAGPFYLAQQREYGSAFHLGASDATFWRNQEFRDRPGFATSEQLQRDPYAGPPISAGEYVFGTRPWSEALVRFLKGYYLTLTFFLPHALGPFWWLLFLMAPGAVWLALKGHWPWLALWALLILPFAFIIPLSVVGHQSVDARFAMHGFPLAAVMMGAGVDWAITGYLRWRERRG